jgi:hypothetical protein|tara:strand:+ start:15 stop:338 length:324 start_codon:yes stop_codon:yes gene_type:complete
MNKEIIEEFVQECIIIRDGKARYKANHIEMCDYFKYSGKVEEYKKEKDWEKNKDYNKKIDVNDSIVNFYFENSKHTMKEIGKVFGVSPSCVRVRIDKYLKTIVYGKK